MESNFEALTSWRTDNLKENNGIIIGSDSVQEKWIPWWIANYSKHNKHPVAIVDLGMSLEMKQWCEKKHEVIPINVPIAVLKNRLPLFRQDDTVRSQKNPMKRYCWFRKPFALLQSPFKNTLWIDLDCLVLGKLDPLFEMANNPYGLAVGVDDRPQKLQLHIQTGVLKPGENNFNSGVVAYQHGAEIVKKWAISVIERQEYFLGDQNLLSRLIGDLGIKDLPIIPKKYNWIVQDNGINPEAVILHFLEESREKAEILLDDFYNIK